MFTIQMCYKQYLGDPENNLAKEVAAIDLVIEARANNVSSVAGMVSSTSASP